MGQTRQGVQSVTLTAQPLNARFRIKRGSERLRSYAIVSHYELILLTFVSLIVVVLSIKKLKELIHNYLLFNLTCSMTETHVIAVASIEGTDIES